VEILFGPVQYINARTLIYDTFNIYTLTPGELAAYSGGIYTDPPARNHCSTSTA
jgi:hypothetical protein